MSFELPASPPTRSVLPVECVNPDEAAFLYHQLWEVGGAGEYLQSPIAFAKSSRPAVLLDVGTNVGLVGVRFADYFASAAPARGLVVHGWEPVPSLRQCAQKNGKAVSEAVRTRGEVHVTVHPFALGGRPGVVEFAALEGYSLLSGFDGADLSSCASSRSIAEYVCAVAAAAIEEEALPALESLPPAGQALVSKVKAGESDAAATEFLETVVAPLLQSTPIEVEVRTLSDEMDRLGVEHVDLLKVDVEGAEWDVLCGLEDRHWAGVDNVIIETHHREDRVARVVKLLQAHGFESVVVRENGPPLFLPFKYLGLVSPPPVETSFERLSTVFASRV